MHFAVQAAVNQRPVASCRGRASSQQQQSVAKAVPKTLPSESKQPKYNQLAAGLLGAAAAAALVLSPPALAKEPFLKATGAKGPLVEEEEQLFRLRQEKEAAALKELEDFKEAAEESVRNQRNNSPDQLCVTPFGVDVVGITEFVALTGALVGGISARRRKEELERLNEQLRTINSQLRQQARAGTLYAPGLTYVPPTLGRGKDSAPGNGAAAAPPAAAAPQGSVGTATLPRPASGAGAGQQFAWPEPSPEAQEAAEAATRSGSTASSSPPAAAGISVMSIDEEDMRPEAKQCLQALKEGKRLLKEQNPGSAMVRFEKALLLSKSLGDKVRERRAMRGLAASARMQGQYRQAIKHLERVLEISKDVRDHVGDADALGSIADIYAELNDFEKAAEYYDKYIRQMATDGPV